MKYLKKFPEGNSDIIACRVVLETESLQQGG
jgi:hypothetical protein